MRTHRTPLVLLVILACAGCQVIRHDYRGDRKITPGTTLLETSHEVGAVGGSRKAMFLFFGLLPLNDASGARLAEDLAVERYGERVTGVTHVRIDEYNSPFDVVVNVLFGFLFSMRTVDVTGRVHEGDG